MRDELVPRLLAGADPARVRGNAFAKAALEQALLDAQLRAEGISLAAFLGAGRDRIVAGAAIGLTGERELRDLAAAYVARGYRRLKCKIEPGRDIDVVRAVRTEVGPDVILAADANGSYSFEAALTLEALDEFGLQCIEQPLAPDALLEHALLAAGLQTRSRSTRASRARASPQPHSRSARCPS